MLKRTLIALLLLAAGAASAHAQGRQAQTIGCGNTNFGQLSLITKAYAQVIQTPCPSGGPVFDFDFTAGSSLPASNTFTRATVSNDFSCTSPFNLTQFASGVADVNVCSQTGTPEGIGIWNAATIANQWARDFTRVAWTKTNITAALTQTGIDGTANSASLLTATAANGSVFQTRSASTLYRVLSVWMKCVVCTGSIYLTQDSGTHEIDVSGSLNSSTWTRVSLGNDPSGGGYWGPAPQASATYGIIIANSGDEVAVDYLNLEEEVAGYTGPTPPMNTVGGGATRNADILSIPLSSISGLNVDSFTVVVQYMTPYWVTPTSSCFLSATGPCPINHGILEVDGGSASPALILRDEVGDANSGFQTTGNLTSGSPYVASVGTVSGCTFSICYPSLIGQTYYDSTTPSNIPTGTTIVAINPAGCTAPCIQLSQNAAGNGTGDTLHVAYKTDMNATVIGGNANKARGSTIPANQLAGLVWAVPMKFAAMAVGYDINTGIGISVTDGNGNGPTPETVSSGPTGVSSGTFNRLLIGSASTNLANCACYIQRITLYNGRYTGSALQKLLPGQ